jgi:hypothetical protein
VAGALIFHPTSSSLAAALATLVLLKLGMEISAVRRITDRSITPMRKTAAMICGRFQPVAFTHAITLLLGGIAVPLLLSAGVVPAWCSSFAFALLVLGEICERYLFFRCVVAPKMPGGLA